MSEQVDAIFDHGVLKPLAPLNLPDQAHVKLTVDPQPQSVAAADVGGRAGGDFDAELETLLFDGPSLPPDFSRADIYADHD
jgi:predicted DNA-binding antitoxin AbrB/MazE fold protein